MRTGGKHGLLTALFCASLIIFCSVAALAQQATLSGTVTDQENGEALPGANVIVTSPDVQTGAAATITGRFIVKNIPPGTYTVIVSFIGYEKKELTGIVLSAGESKVLNIALKLTGIELNPIAVTASRRPEKVLDAPADVAVLEAQQIEARPVLTPAEHLKALPAVDMVTTGLSQSNVVVRGFNNIFSGSLLTLVDNRIARVPSLRVNAYNFIPTPNDDIERIELVLGPGSALYGPNSANGVFHMLTKSPFGSEGTTVSIGGGERSLFTTSIRHAGSYNNKIGYKFSAQFYEGNDFKTTDPVEVKARQDAISAGADPQTLNIGARDYDIEKIGLEGRLDFRATPDLTFIVNGGFNQANDIELTGIGAAQAADWNYSYVQGRVLYKDLFFQAYFNKSDAGDTFLLRTGQPIIDNSSLFVAQLQHSLALGKRQLFTYGLDALITRPNTKGSVNGKNENNDDINEFGAYLQSETEIRPELKFVWAARVDNHNRLEDPTFSPRLALVFKPRPTDNFRVTYNRAFSTPTTNNLFLDITSVKDAFGLGAAFGNPAFGTNIVAQGVPESGFNFNFDASGNPRFRSPFAPLDPRGFSNQDFIDLNDPIFTNVMWGFARQAVLGAFLPTFQDQVAQALAGLGVPPDQIPAQVAALTQAFVGIVPQQVSGVQNVLLALNPTAGPGEAPFFPKNPVDVKRIKETTTQTIEFGYKGIIAKKLVVALDVYHTKVEDFIGPLIVETPNVFLDPNTLAASLGPQFGAALADPNNAQLAQLLLALDNPQAGGNGNGSAVDELTKLFVAGTDNNGAAFIPFGTVSPKEAFDPTAVILTYRNFGDVNLNGLDISFNYFINNNWSIGGTYSFVDDNFFENLGGISDVALNAPRNKFGATLGYRNPRLGLDGMLRLRWVDRFPVNTGVFIGKSDRFAVLDLNANYRLPFSRNTRLSLTIQNLTDNDHLEITGAPKIGRLAFAKITQSF